MLNLVVGWALFERSSQFAYFACITGSRVPLNAGFLEDMMTACWTSEVMRGNDQYREVYVCYTTLDSDPLLTLSLFFDVEAWGKLWCRCSVDDFKESRRLTLWRSKQRSQPKLTKSALRRPGSLMSKNLWGLFRPWKAITDLGSAVQPLETYG